MEKISQEQVLIKLKLAQENGFNIGFSYGESQYVGAFNDDSISIEELKEVESKEIPE